MADPVLVELDAAIAALTDELRRVQEFRAWWASRPARNAVLPAGAAEIRVSDLDAEKQRTGKEWVEKVLSGGVAMRPAEVARAATDLGWKTTSPNKSTMMRNYLRALAEDGKVVEVGGRYRLVRDIPAEEVVTED